MTDVEPDKSGAADGPHKSAEPIVSQSTAKPPALIPAPGAGKNDVHLKSKRQPLVLVLLLILLAGAGGAGWYWWKLHQSQIPPGIVWGNGRVEADDIDITPKYAGRVAELLVDEGNIVKAGQIVARMDTRDTEATLQKSEAQMNLAKQALEEASANLAQQVTQQKLARQELDRTKALVEKGFATGELLDKRQQALDGADAAVKAATARIGQTEQAIAATAHDVAYYKIVVDDGVLRAPRDARVQYRLVNTGEVIAAGSKIFTLLDLSNVYMTLFLPTEEAGKVSLGNETRIVLDALPGLVVPGHVNFVSSTSQFTPKMVETRSERVKLMFRVKARIDPALLANHLADIRTGLPGVAYVKTDSKVAWPSQLQSTVSQ